MILSDRWAHVGFVKGVVPAIKALAALVGEDLSKDTALDVLPRFLDGEKGYPGQVMYAGRHGLGSYLFDTSTKPYDEQAVGYMMRSGHTDFYDLYVQREDYTPFGIPMYSFDHKAGCAYEVIIHYDTMRAVVYRKDG